MKTPVANSASWGRLIVSLTPLIPILWLNERFAPESFPIGGAFAWAAYVLIARRVLTAAHRRGIRLVKSGRFEEAVPVFEEAYLQMCQRPWIDRYRSLLLASASQWSYREMALCNLAFCQGQAGDGMKMREGYERALAEFPGSVLATTALRMIDSSRT